MLRQNYLKLSLIILGIAVLISFLIIRSSSHSSPKITIDNPKPITNSVAQAFSLEQNNQKLTADVKNLEIKDDENMTLKVAQELSQKILEMNADNDLSSGQLQVPNEELFSNEVMQKYKMDFLNGITPATLFDLKIIKDNPPVSSLQYFYDVYNVIYENRITDDIVQEAIANFVDTENADYMKDLVTRFDKAINDWKQISVPSSYADLHLQLINLMILKRTMLAAFYNSAADPIRAMVSSQLLEDWDNQYENWVRNLIKQLNADGIY